MKTKLVLIGTVLAFVLFARMQLIQTTAPKGNGVRYQTVGIKLSVKMVGPYMQAADLQIICAFKHKPSGDTYLGAAKDV